MPDLDEQNAGDNAHKLVPRLVWAQSSLTHLSFNRIEKIEGLESLQRLELLNLSNNRISVIENMDGLEKLSHFFIANNLLGQLDNVLYLRKFKNLFTLNLFGNPVSKENYTFFIAAYFPNLTCLDYRLLNEKTKNEAAVKYHYIIEEMRHNELQKQQADDAEQSRKAELQSHTRIVELHQLSDPDKLKVNLSQYNDDISQLCNSLMSLEYQLANQLEDIIEKLDINISDMVSNFTETVQGIYPFSQSLEDIYNKNIREIADATLKKVATESPEDDMPEEVKMLFSDKDSVMDALVTGHDNHLLKINDRETQLVARVSAWKVSLIKEVLYLRKFKNLFTLNLFGNPVSKENYTFFIAAYFPNLTCLDYRLLNDKTKNEAAVKYHYVMEELRHNELKTQQADDAEQSRKAELQLHTRIVELHQLSDPDELKVKLSQYNNDISQLCNSLMSLEYHLVSQLEDINEKLDINISVMVSNFAETVQGDVYNKNIREIADATLKKVATESPEDDMPEEVKVLFSEKDPVMDALVTGHDNHLLKINDRETQLVARVSAWKVSLIKETKKKKKKKKKKHQFFQPMIFGEAVVSNDAAVRLRSILSVGGRRH
ncbi:hypothetical protein F2P81_014932 [Scophthalmus maximus]|uniref:Dynein regulatory complex subunit 3 n=1 Tax=Scophthalmus maximus TaxID=52904 RepID=A0A6A4SQN4_SCOMX|nr:hypothetical protein F2P81_014932 [Scophthalmus maximus]